MTPEQLKAFEEAAQKWAAGLRAAAPNASDPTERAAVQDRNAQLLAQTLSKLDEMALERFEKQAPPVLEALQSSDPDAWSAMLRAMRRDADDAQKHAAALLEEMLAQMARKD